MQVIVVGGGTVGLGAAMALTARSHGVVVVEPRAVPHDDGSHSGYTRVIRQAYHEGAHYVPWAQESDAAWCELEAGEPGRLLERTGLVEFGDPSDPDFRSAIDACKKHSIDHTCVSAEEAKNKWPFVIPEHWQACFTPSGAYLRVGPCLEAMAARASAGGTAFVQDEVVAVSGGAIPSVRLSSGRTLEADQVVVTAGARTQDLLPTMPQRILRRLMFWIEPPPASMAIARALPTWAGFVSGSFFYGFPYNDEGVTGLKVSCHISTHAEGMDQAVDPASLNRDCHETDWAPVEHFMQEHLPFAGLDRVAHRVCMYSSTPDGHFVLDRHPELEGVVVGAGFSGHGFKFAPALGRVLADIVDGAPGPAEFAWDRRLVV